MEKKVIQTNREITINLDVSAKNVMNRKMIMFRILLYVALKMENI